MKYILAERYALRGFRGGKEPVLLDLESGGGRPLTAPMFSVLKLCDGGIDLGLLPILKPLRQIAEKAAELGWVREAEEGEALREEQKYREHALPHIEAVQWSVTGSCNAKCRHCFVAASQHRHRDLSTAEMLHILDELAESEIRRLSLTGGEPLLRSDLPILLRETAKRGMWVSSVCTNGFLLDDRMLGLFAENGMHPEFQISFDGVGHHDWMRGVDGAEDMTVAAMDSCRRNGFPFHLSMCVHRENVYLIEKTVELAEAHGAKGIRISVVGDIGGFADPPGLTLLTPEEAAPYYLEYLSRFCRRRPDLYIEFCGFMRIHGRHPENYAIIPLLHSCTDLRSNRVCPSVERAFYVSDEGRVLPCIMIAGSAMEEDCLKLTEHSLEACMNGSAYRRFLDLRADELIRRNPKCADCEHLSHCGCGCRGASISAGGSVYDIDKDRCAFFRNRWYDRIRETMDRCLNT